MNKFALFGILLLSVAACDKVTTGHVGIKVNLLGTDKGVQQEVLGPGRYWIGWNEDLFVFPTFTQNEVWTEADRKAIQFQTKEGMTVNADIGISYYIDEQSVPAVFQKYRKGVEELTNAVLRNAVQDSFSRNASVMSVDAVYGSGKSLLIADVLKDLQERYAGSGIVIESLSWRSEVRVPTPVLDAISAKIGAGQKAAQRETEVASAKAEADKAIQAARGESESTKLRTLAEVDRIKKEAEAQAEANRILAQSLSPDLLRSQEIARWNGVLPVYVGGETPVPFMNVPTK